MKLSDLLRCTYPDRMVEIHIMGGETYMNTTRWLMQYSPDKNREVKSIEVKDNHLYVGS
jgi:hypothetical protein